MKHPKTGGTLADSLRCTEAGLGRPGLVRESEGERPRTR